MQVPGGCPPPNRLSHSRSPVDVKVIPPVHGFVPRNPSKEVAAVAPLSFRRKVDAILWMCVWIFSRKEWMAVLTY
jgi:hypothetical protein